MPNLYNLTKINYQFLLKILLVLCLFSFFANVVDAKTVKRGNQVSPIQLEWTIVGGSGTCDGTTNYPSLTDGIRSAWASSSHTNAASPLSLGSSVLAPAGVTYTFTCTDTISGAVGSDTLTVTDCLAGEAWNGTTCVSAYAVTYSGNSNTSGLAPANQTKVQGIDLTLQTNTGSLARTGYTFAGWNTAANGLGTDYSAGGTYSTNAPLTLYAKWTLNSCVNGANNFPTCNTCTFPLGWDGLSCVATYSVTYNANSATSGLAPANQNKVHGVDLTLQTNTGSLARTGYTFAGWNTAANGLGTDYSAGGTYSTNAPLTLYAKWTLNSCGNGANNPPTCNTCTTPLGWNGVSCVAPYLVTYSGNSNTSGLAPANQNKVHGVDLTLQTNTGSLARTGYTFAGWNTAANGAGTDYAAGGTYTTNAPLTLYAKWTLSVPNQPPAPTVSTGVCGGNIDVSWTNDPAATLGYDLQYKLSSGSSWTVLYNVANPVTIPGLSFGGSYDFQIIAENSSGYSTWSAYGVQNASIACVVPTAPILSAPNHTNVTNNSVQFEANLNSDGGSPITPQWRGFCFGTTPAPVGGCMSVGGTGLGSFTQPRFSLTPGTTYYYRGYADNAIGRGWTVDNSFETLPNPVGAIDVTAQACGTGQNYLNWPDSTGASSYSVYNAGTNGWIGNATGSDYLHNGVISTSYSYYVRANNDSGAQTANSGTSLATMTAGPCPQPRLIVCPDPATVTTVSTLNLTAHYWADRLAAPTCSDIGEGSASDVTNLATWSRVFGTAATVSNIPGTKGEVTGTAVGMITARANYLAIDSDRNVTVTAPAAGPANFNAVPGACGGDIDLSWDPEGGVNYYKLSVDGGIYVNIGPFTSAIYNFAPSSVHDFSLIANKVVTGDTAPVTRNNVTSSAACPVPVDGQCGVAERVYTFDETSYTGALCDVGPTSPAVPAFPAVGGVASWQCQGQNGGVDDTCNVSRTDFPTPELLIAPCDIQVEQSTCTGSASWNLQAGTAPFSVTNSANGYSIPGVASTSLYSPSTSITLQYGLNTITARASGIADEVRNLNIACAAGLLYHPDYSVCKAKPALTVTVPVSDNIWIRSGSNSALSYTVSANYPVKCSYYGGSPNPANLLNIIDALTKSFIVGPLTAAQVVKVTCEADTAPSIPASSVSREKRINVIPTYEEQ